MSAAPTLDDLAAALGKARTAHEKRPGDRGAELRFHEARADFAEASLKIALAEAAAAKARESTALSALRRLEGEVSGRIAAIIRKSAQPRQARRASPAAAPLFEIGGAA